LVETAEKSATVYTLVQSQGGIRQEITDEQLSNLGKRFSVTPKAGYLNI
jgi:rhamnulose-1-phosphate aldolase